MSNPRGYPDEIELKVEDRVGGQSDPKAFSTENQQQMAHVIMDMWPATFKEMANQVPWSRKALTETFDQFFGPVGEDITFEEIEDDYGGWNWYVGARRNDQNLTELDPDRDYTKREIDLIVRAKQEGFERGYVRGREAGYEEGQRDALERLGLSDANI